jgi:hypothetical protein
MSADRSSISKAKSYREIGEFWDEHDLADYWDQTEPAGFEVKIGSQMQHRPLGKMIRDKLSIYIPQEKQRERPIERLAQLGKRRERSVNWLIVEAILTFLKREEKRG